MLEASASEQNGKVFFRQEREYRNVALSPKGEPVAAAWLISTYSKEKSTAIKGYETKREIFTIPLPRGGAKVFLVQARIVSHHGLPVDFGKPAEGSVVLETSQKVVLK